ncbi:hypothetical protein F5Y15DRAFT_182441 [Xylariaceae sp. FL0016]|nr:hypothetical protein F5Y15DRAFT_182441 [Xylariaceae sp. FL0016]
MASKTTYIPRFLLPQYGALWQSSARTRGFARPLNAEIGQVLVRYASKTAAASKTTAATTKSTTAKTAAAKVTAPKAASTKASSATPKSAASKAAKASAPTKPPKTSTTKLAATKTIVPKTTAPKTTAPKPATKQAAAKIPVTPKVPAPASATKTSMPPPPPPTATAKTPAPETKPQEVAQKTASTASKPSAAPATADPSKPIVLEKPDAFRPPSHGARLPRGTPKHYGGGPTAEEIQTQKTKQYPGLPPPPNTWSHWFINSRIVHLFITLGTLGSLAIYTMSANISKSPFADMIPPISELPRHPFQYIGICIDVLRMYEEHESAQTAEKRRRKVEDVAKRNEYRKAHGMEPSTGPFWSSGKPEEPVPAPAPVPVVEESTELTPAKTIADEFTPEGKRKKFFGIF